MKTNKLVFDIIRSMWLMSTFNISEYEKLANRFLNGEQVGVEIDRNSFRAAYENGNVGNPFIKEEKEEKQIGYLQMTGPMATYGDGFCTYGADDYLYALRCLNDNDKVGAIVIFIDGPGGAVPAINAFKEFQSEKKKPIVALCADCYSLHYWIICLLADHVMAYGNISSGFGSIGSTCIMVDSREAMKEEGYKILIINADGSDLKNKAMQDFYEGKDEDFIKRIKSELNPIREAFIADVKLAMPDISDDPRIFAADNFSAKEALELKMIHSIGNEKEAFALARALADLNK